MGTTLIREAVKELVYSALNRESGRLLGSLAQAALRRAISETSVVVNADDRFLQAARLLAEDAVALGIPKAEVATWFVSEDLQGT